jgi:hypothetical protein
MPSMKRLWSYVAGGVFSLSALVEAQLPGVKLDGIFPCGVQAGSFVEVAVTGADLGDSGALIFSDPGITAESIDNSRFKVSAGAGVQRGNYEVYFAGRHGVSAPLVFCVSDREEISVPGSAVEPSGAALINETSVINGQLQSGKAHYFKVSAKSGDRIFIECFAERIASRMDALLVLTDPLGIEVGRARESVGGDPLLELTAKSDGDYLLRVSDFQARGGAGYQYRLMLRKGAQVDFILPLSAQPGTKQSFQIYGRNLPGGVPSGDGLERIEVNVDVPADSDRCRTSLLKPVNIGMKGFHYHVGEGQATSNPVFITHSAFPVVVDAGSNADPEDAQHLPFPCEVGGRFKSQSGSWFSFDAKKDQSYVVEIISQRLNGVSDPVMSLEKVTVDKDGKQVVAKIGDADDEGKNIGGRRFPTSHRDPTYLYKADADVKVRIRVRDNYATGNPFRLIVRAPQPGFDLIMSVPPPFQSNAKSKKVERGGIAIRRGQVGRIEVYALRRDGFNEPIELRVEGFPDTFQTTPATMGPGATQVSIPFMPGVDTPAWSGRVRVSGTAVVAGNEVQRQAESAAVNWTINDYDKERVFCRVGESLIVGSVEEKSPLVIVPPEGGILETSLGGKIDLPVKLSANAEVKDKITIKVIDFPGMGKKPPQVQIDKGKVEATLPISLLNNKDGNQFKPGTHRFRIQASTKLGYRRDLDAANRAEEEKKKAVANVEVARKAVDPAKKARDEASKKLNEARAGNAGNEQEKAALVAQAEANLNQEEANLKKAEEELKQAEAGKKDAENRAKQAAERSKPKDLVFTSFTMPLTVKIAETPVRIKTVDIPAEFPKAGKAEITVGVERLYGFADTVEIQFKFADGVKGVTAQNATIAKDQDTVKVPIEIKPDAPAGVLGFETIAKLKFNGIDLQSSTPSEIKVVDSAAATQDPAPAP